MPNLITGEEYYVPELGYCKLKEVRRGGWKVFEIDGIEKKKKIRWDLLLPLSQLDEEVEKTDDSNTEEYEENLYENAEPNIEESNEPIRTGNYSFWTKNVVGIELNNDKGLKILPECEGDISLFDKNILKTLDNFKIPCEVSPLVWKENEFLKDSDNFIRDSLKKIVSKLENKDLYDLNVSVDETFDYVDLIFTLDVVYDIESLSKAFGINKYSFKTSYSKDGVVLHEKVLERDKLETELLGKLGALNEVKDNKPLFNFYLIFNARKQMFEIVFGIKNSVLRKWIIESIQKNSLIEGENPIGNAYALLINSFSMCSNNGKEADEFDLNLYRGNFTPEFYPRRYILKDCIYRQRLDILAYLLLYNIERYNDSNVSYVEFSHGVGDLSKKWVFKVLTSVENYKILEDHFKEYKWFKNDDEKNEFKFKKLYDKEGKLHNFTYKFLAGFSREKVNIENYYIDEKNGSINNKSLDKRLKFLSIPEMSITSFEKECDSPSETKMFKPFIEDLENLLKSFEITFSEDNNIQLEKKDLYELFIKWIVGFDLFGDEIGVPYIPFIKDKFIKISEFVHNGINNDGKILCNKKFGFRIHCGENVLLIPSYRENFKMFLSHMYITYMGIKYLIEKNIRIRIGHGIAFCAFINGEYDSEDEMKSFFSEMKSNRLNLFREKKIPFEINMTSNYYLLHNHGLKFDESNPIKILTDKGIKVILSTDDDGIWPLDKCKCGNNHKSLKYEFCKAIKAKYINDEKSLKEIIDNAISEKFSVENQTKAGGKDSVDSDDPGDDSKDDSGDGISNVPSYQHNLEGDGDKYIVACDKDKEVVGKLCKMFEKCLNKGKNDAVSFKIKCPEAETETLFYSEKMEGISEDEMIKSLEQLVLENGNAIIHYFTFHFSLGLFEKLKNKLNFAKELYIYSAVKEFSYSKEKLHVNQNKFKKVLLSSYHGKCIGALIEFIIENNIEKNEWPIEDIEKNLKGIINNSKESGIQSSSSLKENTQLYKLIARGLYRNLLINAPYFAIKKLKDDVDMSRNIKQVLSKDQDVFIEIVENSSDNILKFLEGACKSEKTTFYFELNYQKNIQLPKLDIENEEMINKKYKEVVNDMDLLKKDFNEIIIYEEKLITYIYSKVENNIKYYEISSKKLDDSKREDGFSIFRLKYGDYMVLSNEKVDSNSIFKENGKTLTVKVNVEINTSLYIIILKVDFYCRYLDFSGSTVLKSFKKFEFKENERFTIISGANGSGKTLFLDHVNKNWNGYKIFFNSKNDNTNIDGAIDIAFKESDYYINRYNYLKKQDNIDLYGTYSKFFSESIAKERFDPYDNHKNLNIWNYALAYSTEFGDIEEIFDTEGIQYYPIEEYRIDMVKLLYFYEFVNAMNCDDELEDIIFKFQLKNALEKLDLNNPKTILDIFVNMADYYTKDKIDYFINKRTSEETLEYLKKYLEEVEKKEFSKNDLEKLLDAKFYNKFLKFSISEIHSQPLKPINDLFKENDFPYEIYSYSEMINGKKQIHYRFRTPGSIDEGIDISLLSAGEHMQLLVNLWIYYMKLDIKDENRAKLLLLDEPDRHFDPKMFKHLYDTLLYFIENHGIQVIMVTHRIDAIILAPSNNNFIKMYTMYKKNGEFSLENTSRLETYFNLSYNERSTFAFHRFRVYAETSKSKLFYSCIYKHLQKHQNEHMELKKLDINHYKQKKPRTWLNLTEDKHMMILSRRYQLSFHTSSEKEIEDKGFLEVIKSVKISYSDSKNLRNDPNDLFGDPKFHEAFGLVDKRCFELIQKNEKEVHDRIIYQSGRYSLENYLLDPFLLCGIYDELKSSQIMKTFLKKVELEKLVQSRESEQELKTQLNKYFSNLKELLTENKNLDDSPSTTFILYLEGDDSKSKQSTSLLEYNYPKWFIEYPSFINNVPKLIYDCIIEKIESSQKLKYIPFDIVETIFDLSDKARIKGLEVTNPKLNKEY